MKSSMIMSKSEQGSNVIHPANDVYLRRNVSFITQRMAQTEEVCPAAGSRTTAVFKLEKPLPIGIVRQIVKDKFISYDSRLRSKLVKESCGKLAWEEVDVDLDRHILSVELQDAGDQRELDEFITHIYQQPMDTQFPLWYFYVISSKKSNKGALISQVHHCVGDGISTVVLWMSIFDEHPESKREMYAASKKQQPDKWSHVHPAFLAHRLFVIVKGILVALLVPFYPADTPTILKLKSPESLSLEKVVAFSNQIPLSKFRDIGHRVGATVNEVYVAIASAALRKYLKVHSPDCLRITPLRIHGVLPLSARSMDEVQLGNKFVFYPIEFPVQYDDRVQMLLASRKASNDMKLSPEGPIFMASQRMATNLLPTSVINSLQNIILTKFTVAFTNVPGATTEQYLGGVKVENIAGCVNSPLGLLLMLSSYSDHITLSMCVDPQCIPNPKELIAYFEEEVDEFHQKIPKLNVEETLWKGYYLELAILVCILAVLIAAALHTA